MSIKGLDVWLTKEPRDLIMDEHHCEMCGQDTNICICPECPRCGEIGNPMCYQEVDLGICGELHGKETLEQKIGKQKWEVRCLKEQLCDAMQALDYLKEQKDRRDNPEDWRF